VPDGEGKKEWEARRGGGNEAKDLIMAQAFGGGKDGQRVEKTQVNFPKHESIPPSEGERTRMETTRKENSQI